MKKSIRNQMRIFLLAGVGILLPGGIVALDLLVENALREQFDREIRTKINLLTMFPELDQNGIDLEFTDHRMPEFEHPSRGEYYQIWLRDGEMMSKSKSLGESNLPLKYGTVEHPLFKNLSLPNGRAVRTIGVRFLPTLENGYVAEHPQERKKYALVLVYARDREPLDRLLTRVHLGFTAIGAAMLLLTVLIVDRALKKGLAPLRQLTKDVEALEAASLNSVRISCDNMPEELKPVARELNSLTDRLGEAFRREQRLTADMAHEMNTPLAELRAAAEVALKWPDDSEAVSGLAERTVETVAHLQRATQALLMLSRQKRAESPSTETVDISQIWHEVRTSQAQQAEKRGIRFKEDIQRNVISECSPELLKIIISNLLDNAVSHSPAGSEIRVILFASGKDGWQFRLENPHPGFKREDLKHVFEPLWQQDGSRTDSRHAGLGLSLVKTAAERLGLNVDIIITEPNIFCVILAKTSAARVHNDNLRT